jgi:hypothetical protein
MRFGATHVSMPLASYLRDQTADMRSEKERFRSPYPQLCHVIAEAEAVLRLMSDLPNVDHRFEWPCR